MKFSSLLTTLLVLSLGMFQAQSLMAADQERPPQSNLFTTPDQDKAEPPISRAQASDIARKSFPGRVISIVPLESRQWRVRMDQDGTVFNVFVDGETGRASRASEQED